jgi:hypothetical protein
MRGWTSIGDTVAAGQEAERRSDQRYIHRAVLECAAVVFNRAVGKHRGGEQTGRSIQSAAGIDRCTVRQRMPRVRSPSGARFDQRLQQIERCHGERTRPEFGCAGRVISR